MFEDLSIGVDSSRMQCPSSSSTKPQYGNLKNNMGEVKKCRSSILHVEPWYLIAENELRRIFGSKVVSSFGKSHQIGNSRQSRGARRGNHNHRRTILITPSEHWPRWDGSLSMELLETKDGFHYFRYLHSSSYRQSQKSFEAAKEIQDLNAIANILMYHPYHMDSLITLAEYFKFSGEHQMSAEAIAKCLYGLECAWHPMFTPLQGNCQLKYDHETNRPFFSTLFIHMKDMDMRGCHRSALEICKLLLSVDSDDPLGAMFCIDYYALRAEEYSWLEQFSEEHDSDSSLWLFPNFAYSLPICRFFREQRDSKDTERDHGRASSCDLMKQALMLYPSVLKKLVDKVPLKGQVWTTILKHSFFGSEETGSPSLDHLINIYVERSHLIWRFPGLQKFLENSANLVIDTLKDGGSDAKDWACVREEAFPSDKNEYHHLRVSDFSDSVPTMAPEDLQHFMIDPRMREENNIQVMNLPIDARDLSNRNPLAVLLESMLPWIDYGLGNRENYQNDQHDRANERVE